MNRPLNWGCGLVQPAGWFHSDIVDLGQEHVGDIRDGLPFDDSTIPFAVANHSLQMLPYADLDGVLREFRRVLRPDGVLRVLVPDAVAAFRAWRQEDAEHFQIDYEDSIDGRLCIYLTQGGTTRSVFTHRWLHILLARAGFVEAGTCVAGATRTRGIDQIVALDSRGPESAIVEACAQLGHLGELRWV